MVRRAGVIHGSVLAAAMLLACIALPTAASATTYSGSQTDPAGDADPGRDLISASARYDDSGSLTAEVKLSAAPSGELQVTVGLGRKGSDGGCSVAPLIVVGAFLPDDATLWLVERDGASPAEEQGYAERSVSGSTVKITAQEPALKGFSPDCAEAVLSDPADTATVYDGTRFTVKPPPPRPKLKAKVSGGSMSRGSSRKVKVSVTNRGTGPARAVTVRLRSRGPATVRPAKRKLGKLAIGQTRVATFRAKAGRKTGRVRLTARVSGRKAKAKASGSIRVTRPAPKLPTGGPGLAGKVFWAYDTSRWDRSAEPVFLHFTNSRFVRWGTPKGRLKSCHRATAKVKNGAMQPGCLRYSYDRRRGKVRIGKVRGTYRRGKLKLDMKPDIWPTDGGTWYLGLLAKRGTRFKTQLINRGFYGCGVLPYCSTWSEYLTLTRDGRFGRSSSSLTTSGGGALPFVGISRLGPDEKGRYRVLSGSRIQFDYADGKRVTEALIVQTDKRGRPDPVREGLLLDGTSFYRED